MAATAPEVSSRQARLYTPRPVLELLDLRKRRGSTQALDGVSLRVAPGEILGLLGPNGAGKSTLVSITSGLLDADSGSVELRVSAALAGPPSDPSIRRHIGLAPQSLAIYAELSGAENLAFFAGLSGVARADIPGRVDAALAFVGLGDRASDRAKTYSGGMARRLNLAAALVHEPSLLLLDEPTVGVDPQSRNHLLDNVEQLRAQGKAVLYTTHYMEEAQRVCDRVAIIDHGQLLAVDRVDTLLREHAGPSCLELEYEGETQRVETEDPLSYLRALEGPPPSSFRVERPTLEQVFLQLTGRSLRDE